MTRSFFVLASVLSGLILLSGCDLVAQRLGIEDPAQKEAKIDAEGRAVGSGCRQSGRAIEDCYAIYTWLPKASIFAGWREMNDYMLENKLSVVEPKLPPPSPEDRKLRRKKPLSKAESEASAAAEKSPDASGDAEGGKASASASTASTKP